MAGRRHGPMRGFRFVLLALGLAFLGYLIAEVGPERILASVEALSWRLLVLLVFPFGAIATLHAVAWRFAFSRSRVPLTTLLAVRLAGEALNVATPAASVGGEPVKVLLLRPRVPLVEALAAVIVDKTTITVAQGLLLALGLAVAWSLSPVPGTLLRAMTWLLVVEVLALGGFVLVQLLGVFGRALGLVSRLGVRPVGSHAREARGLDSALAAFYRRHAARWGKGIFFHFLGWLLGSVEVYLILRFLGVPISPLVALVIEATGTAIQFVAFMVPGRLGVLEGGIMAVFTALGLDPGLGLAQALIRRLRELAWVAVGLAMLGLPALSARAPAGEGTVR